MMMMMIANTGKGYRRKVMAQQQRRMEKGKAAAMVSTDPVHIEAEAEKEMIETMTVNQFPKRSKKVEARQHSRRFESQFEIGVKNAAKSSKRAKDT